MGRGVQAPLRGATGVYPPRGLKPTATFAGRSATASIRGMKGAGLALDTGLRRFALRQNRQDFGGVVGQKRGDGQAEAGEGAAVEQAVGGALWS